jgi:ABC-type branched-subunit amino acid transport system substrate-binding protein
MFPVGIILIALTACLSPNGVYKLKIGVSLSYDFSNRDLLDPTMGVYLRAMQLNQETNLIHPNAQVELVYLNNRFSNSLTILNAVNYSSLGIIGLVGSGYSRMSILTSLILQNYKIPQCCGTSTSPDLGVRATHPYFFRTIPTDEAQAQAIMTYIVSQNWTQIGLLYTNEAYGRGLAQFLEVNARIYGVTILTQQPYYIENVQDATAAVKGIRDSGARIIVSIGFYEPAVRVSMEARKLGLFEPGYVWIASETIFNYPGDPALANYLFTAPIEGRGPAAEEFGNYWRQNRLNTNFEFANFTTTTGPTFYTYYMATCLDVLVKGFDKLLKENPTRSIEDLINGRLSDRVQVPGSFDFPDDDTMTGKVDFDENGNRKGDYYLINMHPTKGLVVVGTISGGKYTPDTSAHITFPGNITEAPSDKFNPTASAQFYSGGSVFGLLGFTCLGIGLLLGFSNIVGTIILRNTELIQSTFFRLTLFLNLLLTISFLQFHLMIGVPTKLTCIFDSLLLPITFALYYSVLFFKNLRLFFIFQWLSRSEMIWKDYHLIFYSFILASPVGIILLVWNIYDPPRPSVIKVSNREYYWTCRSESPKTQTLFLGLLISCAAIIMILNLIIAYRTRRVESKYRESKLISISVYNVFIVGIFAIAILTSEGLSFAAIFLVKLFTVFYVAVFNLVLFSARLAQSMIHTATSNMILPATEIQPISDSPNGIKVHYRTARIFSPFRQYQIEIVSKSSLILWKIRKTTVEDQRIIPGSTGIGIRLQDIQSLEVLKASETSIHILTNNARHEFQCADEASCAFLVQYFTTWKYKLDMPISTSITSKQMKSNTEDLG